MVFLPPPAEVAPPPQPPGALSLDLAGALGRAKAENPMLRAAALRFWISRLWDYHLPREASLLQAHDPSHFERVLSQRLHSPMDLNA